VTDTRHAQDSDLVLQKADALMRRHRVFIAGGAAENQLPDEARDTEPTVDLLPDDENIPLLTEVVPADSAQPNALEAQRQEFADALETWLDEALPQAILKVMDGISDQLIAELRTQARDELLSRLHKEPNN
jgi:hypothetical protein